jgi:hypothetical protein
MVWLAGQLLKVFKGWMQEVRAARTLNNIDRYTSLLLLS